MNPNPCTCPKPCAVHTPEKLIVEEAKAGAQQQITLSPEQQIEVADAMANLQKMLEIRNRIKSLSFKNPYPNKRMREEEIERLKNEHNELRDLYLAAYEKYPFLPH